MSNPSYLDIQNAGIAKAKSFIAGFAEAANLVYERERFAEDENEFVRLLTSLNPAKLATGVLFRWVGWRDNRISDYVIERLERFNVELIYAYDDKLTLPGPPIVQTKSEVRFNAIAAALRSGFARKANINLGLTQSGAVRNLALQAEDTDFIIRRFGEGTGSAIVHYGSMRLNVSVDIDAQQE